MKHFFIKRPILYAALCMLIGGIAFTSCDKESPEVPMLQVGQSHVEISSENNQATVNIKTNSDAQWQASADCQWITVQPTSGYGSGNLDIRVAANPSTADRTGTVTVELFTEDITESISVTQKGMEEQLKVSNSEIRLAAQANASGSFNITSNLPWTITGVDESWLNVSSVSGEGNGTITLSARSDNESSKARECELVINTETLEAKVKVVQPGLYIPECTVKPNDIVVLSDGFALDYIYDEKVAYFYSAAYESSICNIHTDKEIIEDIIEEELRTDTENDWVSYDYNKKPLTEYVICTVAFDKNGNHGDLVKTPVTTKSDRNQAEAYIYELRYNADDREWQWYTSTNATTSRYYMMCVTDEYYYGEKDQYLAFIFQKSMKNSPDAYPPYGYANRAPWVYQSESRTFQVLTWAVDIEGNFSGVLGRSERSRNAAPAKARTNEKRTKLGGTIGESIQLNELAEHIRPIRVK